MDDILPSTIGDPFSNIAGKEPVSTEPAPTDLSPFLPPTFDPNSQTTAEALGGGTTVFPQTEIENPQVNLLPMGITQNPDGTRNESISDTQEERDIDNLFKEKGHLAVDKAYMDYSKTGLPEDDKKFEAYVNWANKNGYSLFQGYKKDEAVKAYDSKKFDYDNYAAILSGNEAQMESALSNLGLTSVYENLSATVGVSTLREHGWRIVQDRLTGSLGDEDRAMGVDDIKLAAMLGMEAEDANDPVKLKAALIKHVADTREGIDVSENVGQLAVRAAIYGWTPKEIFEKGISGGKLVGEDKTIQLDDDESKAAALSQVVNAAHYMRQRMAPVAGQARMTVGTILAARGIRDKDLGSFANPEAMLASMASIKDEDMPAFKEAVNALVKEKGQDVKGFWATAGKIADQNASTGMDLANYTKRTGLTEIKRKLESGEDMYTYRDTLKEDLDNRVLVEGMSMTAPVGKGLEAIGGAAFWTIDRVFNALGVPTNYYEQGVASSSRGGSDPIMQPLMEAQALLSKHGDSVKLSPQMRADMLAAVNDRLRLGRARSMMDQISAQASPLRAEGVTAFGYDKTWMGKKFNGKALAQGFYDGSGSASYTVIAMVPYGIGVAANRAIMSEQNYQDLRGRYPKLSDTDINTIAEVASVPQALIELLEVKVLGGAMKGIFPSVAARVTSLSKGKLFDRLAQTQLKTALGAGFVKTTAKVWGAEAINENVQNAVLPITHEIISAFNEDVARNGHQDIGQAWAEWVEKITPTTMSMLPLAMFAGGGHKVASSIERVKITHALGDPIQSQAAFGLSEDQAFQTAALPANQRIAFALSESSKLTPEARKENIKAGLEQHQARVEQQKKIEEEGGLHTVVARSDGKFHVRAPDGTLSDEVYDDDQAALTVANERNAVYGSQAQQYAQAADESEVFVDPKDRKSDQPVVAAPDTGITADAPAATVLESSVERVNAGGSEESHSTLNNEQTRQLAEAKAKADAATEEAKKPELIDEVNADINNAGEKDKSKQNITVEYIAKGTTVGDRVRAGKIKLESALKYAQARFLEMGINRTATKQDLDLLTIKGINSKKGTGFRNRVVNAAISLAKGDSSIFDLWEEGAEAYYNAAIALGEAIDKKNYAYLRKAAFGKDASTFAWTHIEMERALLDLQAQTQHKLLSKPWGENTEHDVREAFSKCVKAYGTGTYRGANFSTKLKLILDAIAHYVATAIDLGLTVRSDQGLIAGLKQLSEDGKIDTKFESAMKNALGYEYIADLDQAYNEREQEGTLKKLKENKIISYLKGRRLLMHPNDPKLNPNERGELMNIARLLNFRTPEEKKGDASYERKRQSLANQDMAASPKRNIQRDRLLPSGFFARIGQAEDLDRVRDQWEGNRYEGMPVHAMLRDIYDALNESIGSGESYSTEYTGSTDSQDGNQSLLEAMGQLQAVGDQGNIDSLMNGYQLLGELGDYTTEDLAERVKDGFMDLDDVYDLVLADTVSKAPRGEISIADRIYTGDLANDADRAVREVMRGVYSDGEVVVEGLYSSMSKLTGMDDYSDLSKDEERFGDPTEVVQFQLDATDDMKERRKQLEAQAAQNTQHGDFVLQTFKGRKAYIGEDGVEVDRGEFDILPHEDVYANPWHAALSITQGSAQVEDTHPRQVARISRVFNGTIARIMRSSTNKAVTDRFHATGLKDSQLSTVDPYDMKAVQIRACDHYERLTEGGMDPAEARKDALIMAKLDYASPKLFHDVGPGATDNDVVGYNRTSPGFNERENSYARKHDDPNYKSATVTLQSAALSQFEKDTLQSVRQDAVGTKWDQYALVTYYNNGLSPLESSARSGLDMDLATTISFDDLIRYSFRTTKSQVYTPLERLRMFAREVASRVRHNPTADASDILTASVKSLNEMELEANRLSKAGRLEDVARLHYLKSLARPDGKIAPVRLTLRKQADVPKQFCRSIGLDLPKTKSEEGKERTAEKAQAFAEETAAANPQWSMARVAKETISKFSWHNKVKIFLLQTYEASVDRILAEFDKGKDLYASEEAWQAAKEEAINTISFGGRNPVAPRAGELAKRTKGIIEGMKQVEIEERKKERDKPDSVSMTHLQALLPFGRLIDAIGNLQYPTQGQAESVSSWNRSIDQIVLAVKDAIKVGGMSDAVISSATRASKLLSEAKIKDAGKFFDQALADRISNFNMELLTAISEQSAVLENLEDESYSSEYSGPGEDEAAADLAEEQAARETGYVSEAEMQDRMVREQNMRALEEMARVEAAPRHAADYLSDTAQKLAETTGKASELARKSNLTGLSAIMNRLTRNLSNVGGMITALRTDKFSKLSDSRQAVLHISVVLEAIRSAIPADAMNKGLKGLGDRILNEKDPKKVCDLLEEYHGQVLAAFHSYYRIILHDKVRLKIREVDRASKGKNPTVAGRARMLSRIYQAARKVTGPEALKRIEEIRVMLATGSRVVDGVDQAIPDDEQADLKYEMDALGALHDMNNRDLYQLTESLAFITKTYEEGHADRIKFVSEIRDRANRVAGYFINGDVDKRGMSDLQFLQNQKAQSKTDFSKMLSAANNVIDFGEIIRGMVAPTIKQKGESAAAFKKRTSEHTAKVNSEINRLVADLCADYNRSELAKHEFRIKIRDKRISVAKSLGLIKSIVAGNKSVNYWGDLGDYEREYCGKPISKRSTAAEHLLEKDIKIPLAWAEIVALRAPGCAGIIKAMGLTPSNVKAIEEAYNEASKDLNFEERMVVARDGMKNPLQSSKALRDTITFKKVSWKLFDKDGKEVTEADGEEAMKKAAPARETMGMHADSTGGGRLSRAQVLQLVNDLSNPRTAEANAERGYDEQTIAEAKAALDPEYLEFGQWMVSYISDVIGPMSQDANYHTGNAVMEINPGFWPSRRMGDIAMLTPDEVMSGMSAVSAGMDSFAAPGILRGSDAELDFTADASVVFQQFCESSIHHAEVTSRTINDLYNGLTNARMRQQLTALHGVEKVKVLAYYVDTAMNNGRVQDKLSKLNTSFLNKVATNMAKILLAFRVPSWIKQLPDGTRSLFGIDRSQDGLLGGMHIPFISEVVNVVEGMFALTTNAEAYRIVSNNSEVRLRAMGKVYGTNSGGKVSSMKSGGVWDAYNYVMGIGSKVSRAGERVTDIGLRPLSIFDVGAHMPAVLGQAAVTYRNVLKQTGSKEEAKAAADAAVTALLNRYAQPKDALAQSSLNIAIANNPILRVTSLMKSPMIKILSNTVSNVKNVGSATSSLLHGNGWQSANTKSASQSLSELVVTNSVASCMAVLAYDLSSQIFDDPETYEKKMRRRWGNTTRFSPEWWVRLVKLASYQYVGDVVGGIPMVGNAIDIAAGKVFDQQVYASRDVLTSTIMDAVVGWNKIHDGTEDKSSSRTNMEGWTKIAKTGVSVAAITPIGNLGVAIGGLLNAWDSVMNTDMGRVILHETVGFDVSTTKEEASLYAARAREIGSEYSTQIAALKATKKPADKRAYESLEKDRDARIGKLLNAMSNRVAPDQLVEWAAINVSKGGLSEDVFRASGISKSLWNQIKKRADVLDTESAKKGVAKKQEKEGAFTKDKADSNSDVVVARASQ